MVYRDAAHPRDPSAAVVPKDWIPGAREPFVGPSFATLDDLPAGAVVATSSTRRAAQVLAVRPALDLVPGCLVERYLQNDDQVLFNRQPTLHRMSMMAHRVLIMKGSTFRLNLSCTTPYNADFDGDEMNCHVPQSIAAQTEAAEILGVPHQIVAPQSNKPCMGLVQDTLLGTYLLTSPDTFIDRAQVMQLLMQLKYPADPDLIRLLPRPAVLRPRELWTGAQVFSVLLPRGLFMGRPLAAWPDPGQAEVRVHDGQLLHGRLRKQHVGIAAAGIIHLLFLDFDPHLTARFMSEAQRLVNHWLMGRGFSIGIRDCVRPESTRREVAEYVALANHHVDAIAAAARTAGAAASAVEMEDISQDILTKVLAAAGGIVAEHLAGTNLAQTIASGSKGNPINMAQIAGVVGQQCVDGGRIQPPMPCARSLHHVLVRFGPHRLFDAEHGGGDARNAAAAAAACRVPLLPGRDRRDVVIHCSAMRITLHGWQAIAPSTLQCSANNHARPDSRRRVAVSSTAACHKQKRDEC